MADFTARDVAELRKQTRAGMMDCKRALEACAGDVEAAKDWLRREGLAGAANRGGRTAEQGAVDVVVDGRVGAVVELNCETDFVAKGADFTRMVADLARLVAERGDEGIAEQPYDGVTVGEAVAQLGAKLGEKVGLGRMARYETSDGLLDGYKHIQNERGTIGVLIELGGVDASEPGAREVAHDIALHIASAAPLYVTRDDVPGDVVEKERSLLEEITRKEGKPEQAVPKIVEGRLNSFFKDVVLLDQPFVREGKATIRDLVSRLGPGVAVRRFVRIKVGEE